MIAVALMLGALFGALLVLTLFVMALTDHARRIADAVETIANLTVRQAQVLEAQLEALDRERPIR